MSHFSHDRSALLRQTPQRLSVPLGRDPRRVLRLPRSPCGRTGPRCRRQRRSAEAAACATAGAGGGRVRAARAQPECVEVTVGCAAGAGSDGFRGLETIRSVLLEAATSTTRESWATCTCPECGKGFRQEISVPDHGARIKAVETLLREGLGRVGEAEVVEPKVPKTIAEVQALGRNELSLIFATAYAPAIRAVADHGDEALLTELQTWEPESRAALSRALDAVS